MNLRHLVFIALIFSYAVLNLPNLGRAHQRKKPKSCWHTALTQGAMNECAGKELRASEARLDALLKKLGVGPEDPAQKTWEAYREAQLEAIYPNPKENIADYGSVFPMCFAIQKRKLVEGRIRDLKALTTSGEGDVCYGLKPVSQKDSHTGKSLAQSSGKAQGGVNLCHATR